MKAVEGFVRENRQALSHNIKGLDDVSKILVKQRAALDEVLRVAPTTLANLFHTYNPANGTLDTRTNVGENLGAITGDPVKFVCGILSAADPKSGKSSCDLLQKALPASPGPAAPRRSADRGQCTGETGGDRGPVPRRHPGGAQVRRTTSRAARATRRRVTRAVLAMVVGALALSGCDFSVYSLPLPGGADLGDHPYTVK